MSFFLGEQFNLTGIQKNDTILRNISVPQFGLNEVLLQRSTAILIQSVSGCGAF